MRFQDKIVIITGGNAGIGKAIVQRFTKEGASVVIAARNVERSREVLTAVEANGGVGHVVACDVRDPDACQAVVDETIAKFGRLDVLVNNAGVAYRQRDVVHTELDVWHKTFDVNVHGMFYMSKFAMPHLLASKGVVVNMASYLGLVGIRDMVAYVASKGAVVQMTRAMALDHAEAGVRVNCVCPGSVRTPLMEQAWAEYGEGAQAAWRAKHPLKRIGHVDEIADVVCFLASNESSFITGAAIPIDGGITAG